MDVNLINQFYRIFKFYRDNTLYYYRRSGLIFFRFMSFGSEEVGYYIIIYTYYRCTRRVTIKIVMRRVGCLRSRKN